MIGKPKRIVRCSTSRLKPKPPQKRGISPVARRSTKIPKSLLKRADEVFSLKIRARDGHCQFPGCQSTNTLQCSHYIGRATKSTRFDEDNCITLCWYHHYKSKDLGFEYQKQTKEKHGFDGQYTLFMRRHLGKEGLAKLNRRSKVQLKLTREKLENLIQTLSAPTTI